MGKLVCWLSKMPPRTCAVGLALLHLTIALLYKHVVGIDIEADPTMTWDWLWQTLSAEALRTDLWNSLWNFHAQPPLYNVYGAFFARVSIDHQLQLMHYSNILLGSLLVGMVFLVVHRETNSQGCGLIAGVLVALHPGLFLAEAYVLYMLVTTFLVVCSVFFLSCVSSEGNRLFALLFVAVIACLVLTRSLYHLAILVVAVGFVLIVVRRGRWVVVLGSILILAVPAGWYAKNSVKFDFFGASSWYGLNLWNAVSSGYTQEERERLVDNGILDPIVAKMITEQKRSFSRPSAYREYGFTRGSDEAVLSQDDYNNINIPAISKLYFQNSLRVIRYDPAHYLEHLFLAYAKYSAPACRDPHHKKNIKKPVMHVHEFLYYRVMQGQWLANQVGWGLGTRSLGSFSFVVLPAALLWYGVLLLRSCRRDFRRWGEYLRRDPAMAFAWILIIYTTVVGCTFEFNENQRFRFLIDPVFLAFLVVLIYRIWKKGGQCFPVED